MLGLTLREEFRGKRLRGTAIELSNDTNTGATQIAAQEFLGITYPTHDLLKGVEAVGPNQGRKWENMGAVKTDITSDQLILELLQHTPTMLLLDEFQTWYNTVTPTSKCIASIRSPSASWRVIHGRLAR